MACGLEVACEIFAPLGGIFSSFNTFPFCRILYLPEFFGSGNRIRGSCFKGEFLWDVGYFNDSLKGCRNVLYSEFPWILPRITPQD